MPGISIRIFLSPANLIPSTYMYIPMMNLSWTPLNFKIVFCSSKVFGELQYLPNGSKIIFKFIFMGVSCKVVTREVRS